MSSSPEIPDREIKARKSVLYEGPADGEASGAPRKQFTEYLRETPPDPLSVGVKAALIVAGIVVGLVFIASLIKGLSGKPRPRPTPASGTSSIVRPWVPDRA
jgi:hypothetical protein